MSEQDQVLRQKEFARNPQMEELLAEVNGLLAGAEDGFVQRNLHPRLPIIMLLGAPRCGSTLFMQWLASTGAFCYPSNFLSRFYRAPVIGAKIQKLLCDRRYAFRDELFDLSGHIDFQSHLGKTVGALSPNEFWYFWRRFFPIDFPQLMTDQQLSKGDLEFFLAEMAGIQDVFGQPFALKAMLLNFHAAWLAKSSPMIFFVHLVREPEYNMQSLLEARRRFFGDIETWYSTKPPEYQWLIRNNPYIQIAGQLYFTTRAIDIQMSMIPNSKWIKVRYEDFCSKPGQVFTRITEMIGSQANDAWLSYNGPEKFKPRNNLRGDLTEIEKMMAAYNEFSRDKNHES